MVVDRHGRRHLPAGSPDSKGGEYAPKWVTAVAGRLTRTGQPRRGRPGRPRNAQRGLRLPARGSTQGVWGGSHGSSFQMAGASAAIMGISGYRYDREWDQDQGHFFQAAATDMLRVIYDGSQPSDVRRFHGTKGKQWAGVQAGDVVDLPLTATARDRGTITYGVDYEAEREGRAEPTYLIVFPKGTASFGISHEWDENGDYRLPTWDEAVVAGRFRVVSRDTVEGRGEGHHTRIELEPVEVYDPTRRRWVPPRRRLKLGPDHGDKRLLVAQLRDGGGRVHRDGTVSVWKITNIGNADGEPTVEYTTNGKMARERAGWRDEPEPEEVRLPLDQVEVLFRYSDETRIAVPDWARQLVQRMA